MQHCSDGQQLPRLPRRLRARGVRADGSACRRHRPAPRPSRRWGRGAAAAAHHCGGAITRDRERNARLAADVHSRSSRRLTPLPFTKRCPHRWPTAAGEHDTGWEGGGWAVLAPQPPPPPPPRRSSSSTGSSTGAGKAVRPRPSSCRVRYSVCVVAGRQRPSEDGGVEAAKLEAPKPAATAGDGSGWRRPARASSV